MCGRYNIHAEEDIIEMQKIVAEIDRRFKGTPELAAMKTGEIFPTNIVPIYTFVDGLAALDLMKWGFRGFKGNDVIINARSETVAEKPIFRSALQTGRCLVIASNYYEWEARDGKKIKQAIKPQGPGLLYMAGIFRRESDSTVPVFTILTREAAPGIRHIHNRMPVILGRGARSAWMRSENPNITAILDSALTDMVYAPAV